MTAEVLSNFQVVIKIMLEEINQLNERIKYLESRFSELGYDMTAIVQSEYKKKWKILPQSQALYGLFTALCVDTIDPLKQNKVRFYSPYFHRNNADIQSLDWAYPVSSAGGFDDCGLNWVPPAGSTLCIEFERGNRATPFYLGTTWHRDRGPDGQHNWGFPIKEYYDIHEGHRKGYLVGPNDGSQVFPPWNTESSNGYDYDTITDFEKNSDAVKKITYPNIYGLKTPQKHMQKWVDGDYKCNHKFKRMEWLSSCGNGMIFKDDWLHNSGTWVHPSAGISSGSMDCVDENGKPKEKDDCQGLKSNKSILGGHPSTPEGTTYGLESNQGSNPYFKHANELRPYKGPGTPQNNKYCLPQSGWQVLTRSGQTMFMDDSVEEPRGIPDWESSTKDFDYGCNNKYLGNITIMSSTGHRFQMNDAEEQSQLRGPMNRIQLKTATGNLFEMNDHTTGKKDCPGCPPNLAGEKNGIAMVTASNHSFMMLNEGNEHCSPCRKSTGEVDWDSSGSGNTPKAKKAFVRIRSGYGLEFIMRDDFSQQKTQQQYIRIYCPQKDNKERGPHFLALQEAPSGAGLVFLRVGGEYVCTTYDDHTTIVGDKEKHPANKLVYVTKNNYEITVEKYVNLAKDHFFLADDYILLLAGNKLPPMCKTKDDGCVTCPCPVVCINQMGNLVISDRVFVSASPSAKCVSIEQLLPFTQCEAGVNCDESGAGNRSSNDSSVVV
jgi:hypothetical protein